MAAHPSAALHPSERQACLGQVAYPYRDHQAFREQAAFLGLMAYQVQAAFPCRDHLAFQEVVFGAYQVLSDASHRNCLWLLALTDNQTTTKSRR